MNPQKPGQERGDHRLRPGTSQAGPPLDASKAGNEARKVILKVPEPLTGPAIRELTRKPEGGEG